jgi:hypothetical protein
MKKVTVFRCDFCNKTLKTEKGAKKHEENCNHRIEKRACAGCGHFKHNLLMMVDDFIDCGYWKLPIKDETLFRYQQLCFNQHNPDCDTVVFPIKDCKYWDVKIKN